MEGVDGIHPSPPTPNTFLVRAQEIQKKRVSRAFNFCAENKEQMVQWIRAFKIAMRPMEWLDSVKDNKKRMSLLSNISRQSSGGNI